MLLTHHPNLSNTNRQAIPYPKNVVVSPAAYLQILSHQCHRRKDGSPVVGTLVGTRSEDSLEVEVKHCYMIPVATKQNEVSLPVDYHVDMFANLRKAHPDYSILGWYATTNDLTGVSGLIQTFFSREDGTMPYPPVHLTISPTKEAVNLNAYIASPLYTSPETSVVGNFIFVPIAHEIRQDLVSKQITSDSKSTSVEQSLEQLDAQLEELQKLAASAQSQKNNKLAKLLYKNLNKVVLESAEVDPLVTHIRDLNNVLKLSQSINTQISKFSTN